jgi:ABC-type anion transport system duplicated permease subunit
LVSSATFTNNAYQNALRNITRNLISQGASPMMAARRAAAQFYELVQQQATMLSYLDVFKMLGILSFLMIGLVLFLKRLSRQDMGHAPAH